MNVPAASPQRQGLVLSDLHLFTARSDGAALFEDLRPKLATLDVLILNGDTFDFRWSTFADHAASAQAALAWLTQILHHWPHCDLHFVLGNHDCLDAFTAQLPSLTERHPNFHWHPLWLQLGNRLFLHGDCAQYAMDAAGLDRYRTAWRHDQQRGHTASAAYTAADALRITALAHRLTFPHRRTIQRIGHYLDYAYPDWRGKTQHCYFGHTHRPFSHQTSQNILFHNTGSAIRGMGFKPLRFQHSNDP